MRSSSRLAAPDPAEILTHRLAQLGDRRWMRSVLEYAIDQLCPHTFNVEAYQIDHCKVTPWRDISLAFAVTLRSRTGAQSRQLLSGAVLASVVEARRHFHDELLASGPEVRHRADDKARRRASVALVPEMAMVVRLFPADSALSGLACAVDKRSMCSLLAAHLPECRDEGWRIADLECEPVQYKPRRLCTLRYTLALAHPQRRRTRHVEVFGKAYRDDRWRRSYALLEAAWLSSRASGGAWTAPRPLAAVEPWAFIVQSAIPGRQFRHVLADLTSENATADDLRQAHAHVTAVARAARGLQLSSIQSGPRLDFKTLLEAQRGNLDHLRSVQPALASELHRLRIEIEREASATPPTELRFAHGDFAHGNVMLDEGRPGIIDFDRAGQAEPAYDVAYFLTHLASFSLRHPERAGHVRQLCDRLRASYCQLAPEVSAERLALYEALDSSAYVLRNFRKRSHQPEWIGWATGQIASAWERLAVAVRRRSVTS
jgi:Ser/Thr protein kinase RdoA (MazF antagonist)